MGISLVTYGGNKLEPAPFVSINEVPIRTEAGEKIGARFRITLTQQIITYMGSPKSNGSIDSDHSNHAASEVIVHDARLGAALRKIEAIKNLFETDGLKLAIQSADGSPELYCYPTVINVTFDQDRWYNTVPYTIELEAPYIFGLLVSTQLPSTIQNASENWDLAPDTFPNSFAIRHTVSAVGLTLYDSGIIPTGAWIYARNYVMGRIGFDNWILSGSLLKGGLDFDAYTPWNYVRNEVIDELGGSYSMTESWLYFNQVYTDTYTSSVAYLTDDPQKTTTINVRGTIRGFYSGLNQQAGAYTNAISGWSNVQPQLPLRANDFGTVNFINGNVDHDEINGVISYEYLYDDRPIISGASDEYVVTRQWSNDSYITNISVDGKIVGKINAGESGSLKYVRAFARWMVVEPALYGRALTYASGIPNVKSPPVTRQVSENPIEGSITYNYAFNNRENALYEDTYSVSYNFSRQDGLNNVTVQGIIKGVDGYSGIKLDRYNYAFSGLPTDATIFNRAQTYGTLDIYNAPIQKELVHNIGDGSVSYNYAYNSRSTGVIPGSLSELVTITDVHPGQVVPRQPVIGRAQGPILQNPSTFTARERQVTIEVVVPIPFGVTDHVVIFGYKPDTNAIVSGFIPANTYQCFREEDQETFAGGSYTRNTKFVYEV